MTEKQLISSRNQTAAQIQNNRTAITSVDAELLAVKEAQKKLSEIKNRVISIYTTLQKLDYNDESKWKGEKRTTFEDNLYAQNTTDIDKYIADIDDLLDSLIDKETELIDRKNEYGIVIEQLNDFWNWICGEIRKIIN